MVKRRKMLLGLGSLAAGGAAAMGTGAISSTTAKRNVSVTTAGDASAYLGMTGNTDYIKDDSDGELSINIGASGTGTGHGGSGLNQDAVTALNGVITLTNQDDEAIDISLSGDSGFISQVGNVDNVKLKHGEGIYFSLDNDANDTLLEAGASINIDVAIVEAVDDGNDGVPGGTLTISAAEA